MKDYRSLGFHVLRGGFHSGGYSQNALIYLSDGIFLELFAFRSKFKIRFFRFWWRIGLLKFWAKPAKRGHIARFGRAFGKQAGLIDYCLRTPNLARERERLRGAKLKVSKPKTFYRLRPDQIRMSWELLFPANQHLPFLMGPVLPDILRSQDDVEQVNGVTGCKSITLAVRNLEEQVSQFQQLLKVEPERKQSGSQTEVVFTLNSHQIRLLEAKANEREGLLELTLLAPSLTEEKVLPLDQAHYCPIRLLPS